MTKQKLYEQIVYLETKEKYHFDKMNYFSDLSHKQANIYFKKQKKEPLNTSIRVDFLKQNDYLHDKVQYHMDRGFFYRNQVKVLRERVVKKNG